MKLTGAEIAKIIGSSPDGERVVNMVFMGSNVGNPDVPEPERRHLWVRYEPKEGCADQKRYDFIGG